MLYHNLLKGQTQGGSLAFFGLREDFMMKRVCGLFFTLTFILIFLNIVIANASPCEGDFEIDGDVDGYDLAMAIKNNNIPIEVLSNNFGSTNCSIECPELVYEGTYEIQNLEDLEALRGYTSVGRLYIHDSDLTTLNGLGCLTYAGFIDIENNNALTSLEGLKNLTSYLGALYIANNGSLTNLEELNDITEISYFVIENNSSLKNLKELENLEYIATAIIENNDALINLEGLSSLTWIYEELFIEDNDAILNLEGLTNLFYAINFWIIDNDSLVSLEGLGPPEEHYLDCNRLFLINNKSITSLGLKGLGIADELYVANNPSLTSLKGGLWGLGEFEFLTVYNNDSLINLEGCESIYRMLGDILIEDNDSLLNLKGLENLGNGNINIKNNNSLSSLYGLENLKHAQYLLIENNELLTSISELSNLEWVDSFSVINNQELCTSNIYAILNQVIDAMYPYTPYNTSIFGNKNCQ